MWTGSSQWRDHEPKTCCSKHALPFHLPAFTASSAPFAETSTSTQPAKWKDDASENHIIIFWILPYSTLFLMTIFEVFFAVRLHPTENRTCKSIFKVPLWPWLSEPYPPSGWKIWNLVAQIPRHRQDSKTTRLHSFLDRIHQTESDYSALILYIGEIPLTFILWRFRSHGKSHGKSRDRDSQWRSKTKVWVP